MSQPDFEKPILELESKIAELRHVDNSEAINIAEEISRMQNKAEKLLKQTYSKLNAEQKVQVARHQERPHFLDYVTQIVDDFMPLAGDRHIAENHSLIGGIGKFRGQSCIVMGHEKGHDTETRIKHNFGMARPEGYRKAQRLLALAQQFNLPVITLVDTAGAYPGVGAEERGQSEAIAKSIESCLRTEVPIISVIIGEGGSGGAIAIATADRVYMLEHAIYSVISPEGCASILWKTASFAKEAASALKLTAQDLMELKLIDGIIEEPMGGAHRNKQDTILNVANHIEKALNELTPWDGATVVKRRREKFLQAGRNI